MRNRKRQIRAIRILMTVLMFFSLITPGFVSAESTGKPYVSLKESSVSPKEKLSNSLLDEFTENDEVRIIVKFAEKANTKKAAKLARENAQKQNLSAFRQTIAQRSAVISELKTTALQSQGNVLSFLENEEVKGNAKDISSLHIVNAVVVTTTEEVAEKLSSFKEVERIVPNGFNLLSSTETIKKEPVEKTEERIERALQAEENNLQATEWNVDRVNAPDVWSLGFDGSGIIIANMDTGVQWDHPALKEKYLGYDAETGEVDHSIAFFDPVYGRTEAYDIDGHGTHVMGTMVGGEA